MRSVQRGAQINSQAALVVVSQLGNGYAKSAYSIIDGKSLKLLFALGP